MKNSFVFPAAIIGIANAVALIHGGRNRSGTPDSELLLTNQEAGYFRYSTTEDNSGVTLDLHWTDPSEFVDKPVQWLDREKLQNLGFDCSRDTASPGADRFYQRQRPRAAFVALEYDGPAWHAWLEASRRDAAKRQAMQPGAAADYSAGKSHLMPIDADLDPAKLRARHPDRNMVLIMPTAIAIVSQPGHVAGRIREMSSIIHVQRPFSDGFRNLDPNRPTPGYRVRLRYGALLEPWVTGVEFER